MQRVRGKIQKLLLDYRVETSDMQSGFLATKNTGTKQLIDFSFTEILGNFENLTTVLRKNQVEVMYDVQMVEKTLIRYIQKFDFSQ